MTLFVGTALFLLAPGQVEDEIRGVVRRVSEALAKADAAALAREFAPDGDIWVGGSRLGLARSVSRC